MPGDILVLGKLLVACVVRLELLFRVVENSSNEIGFEVGAGLLLAMDVLVVSKPAEIACEQSLHCTSVDQLVLRRIYSARVLETSVQVDGKSLVERTLPRT